MINKNDAYDECYLQGILLLKVNCSYSGRGPAVPRTDTLPAAKSSYRIPDTCK